jgi:glycosyltransferase involved in cell wall biosynthesis
MKYQLSICIPTFNRGNYIGETLKSIVSQWEHGVEIVIVDGGSTDNTESVVDIYRHAYPDIRYVKKKSLAQQPSNEGFDRDCDYAVTLARGDYCWLMTDDDLFNPGALKKVLTCLKQNYALLISNVEVKSKDFSELLLDRRLDISQDRIFDQTKWNDFAQMICLHLTFVGAVIIKKQIWIDRKKEKYFGSGFVHVGVIFDGPINGSILVIADNLICIRYGNAQWSGRAFQIWMLNWPSLVWSLPSIPTAIKTNICQREPWKNLGKLLLYRATGRYTVIEYHRFIKGEMGSAIKKRLAYLVALIPRLWLYIPAWVYIKIMCSGNELSLFDLKSSMVNHWLVRLFKGKKENV